MSELLEVEDTADIEMNEVALERLAELIEKRLQLLKERREMKWKEKGVVRMGVCKEVIEKIFRENEEAMLENIQAWIEAAVNDCVIRDMGPDAWTEIDSKNKLRIAKDILGNVKEYLDTNLEE